MIRNNLLNLDWLFQSPYWEGPDVSNFDIINISDGVIHGIKDVLSTYVPNGKKIIFVRPHEIYTPDSVTELLSTFLDKHNITDASIILNNYYVQEELTQLPTMNIIWCDYFLLYTEFLHRVFGQKHNLKYNPNADKDFRLVIGKPDKPNRANLLVELHSQRLLDNSYASILCEDKYLKTLSQHTVFNDEYSYNALSQYNKSIDDIEFIQQDDLNLHCQGFPYDETKFTDSAISIVPETTSYNHIFITEKIYYAIYNNHPFVICSTPGTLAELRKLGYKTFDSVIDESYDLCTDIVRRLQMVGRSAKQLLEHKHDRVVKDIVDFNNQLFATKVEEEIKWIEKQIRKLS